MKKRIIALSASVVMLFALLSACGSQENGNESIDESLTENITQKEESQKNDESVLSESGETVTDSDTVTDEVSEYCEQISDEIYGNDTVISDESGTYVIDEENGNGFYLADFTMESDEIVLADGRRIPLSYTEFVYDETDMAYLAVINGRNYRLSEYTDCDGALCQSLECTDEIEGFAVTASVLYYPELEYGNITMGFTFEKNGNNEYIFTYPDGHSETRTVYYDGESGMYYFG